MTSIHKDYQTSILHMYTTAQFSLAFARFSAASAILFLRASMSSVGEATLAAEETAEDGGSSCNFLPSPLNAVYPGDSWCSISSSGMGVNGTRSTGKCGGSVPAAFGVLS